MFKVVMALTLSVALAHASCTLSSTLKAAATAKSRYFGTCISKSYLSLSSYTSVAKTHFNLITAENECKMDATEPSQGTFSYTSCDAILSFATSNSMKFRGHALVWGEQYPSWVKSLSSSGKKSAMQNHIKTMLTHYKGKAYAWDVVNEAVADGSSSLKSTVWYPSVSSYIDVAFTAARSADSSTKLFYNDYSIDGVNTKSTYTYTMVKSMLQRSIPIDGVGFQMHISSTYYPTQADMTTNFKRFAALGLEIHITEADVGISSSSQYDVQAKIYGYVMRACLAVSKCKSFEVWGVTDKYTWRTGKLPLLFDSSYNAKTAACTLRSIMLGTSSAAPTCNITSLPDGATGWGTCSTSVGTGVNCSLACQSGLTAVSGLCAGSTWERTPSCVEVSSGSCALPEVPITALDEGTCTAYTASGSSCSFNCSTGYTATQATCSSGVWAVEPACVADPCTLSELPEGASGWGTCSGTTKSGKTCSVECSKSAFTVTGVCVAGAWNPTPGCFANCSMNATCSAAGKTCGWMWNGCAPVSCGNCTSGYRCDGKACVAMESQWAQVAPDSYTTLNWNVTAAVVTLTNFTLPSVARVLAYSGPEASMPTNHTTVTVFVEATEGDVSLGALLGQGSGRELDRMEWKVTVASGVASVALCRTYKGSESCKTAGTSIAFVASEFHNLTVDMQVGDKEIAMNAWIDGAAVSESYLTEDKAHFPNPGKLFVGTKNSATTKAFKGLAVRTTTTMRVVHQECMPVDQWNAHVANILGVNLSAVSTVVVGGGEGCGSASKRSMVPFEVLTTLADQGDVLSPTMATMLQSAISDGALVANQVTVTAAAAVAPSVAAGVAAFSVGAGLSTAAVAGIAAGCSVGGLLVVGAAGTAVAVAVKKSGTAAEAEAAASPPKRRTFIDRVLNRGVDVMGNNADGAHTSITNRAPPVQMN